MKLIGQIYGLLCYLLGVASLVAFILFANNFMGLLGLEPLNIDRANVAAMDPAWLVNVLLIALFGVQHSVMARPGFKSLLTKLLPAQLERSTYVLATALVIAVILYYWQPMRASLWRVDNDVLSRMITVVYFLGWTITLLATFMLNHFHLFGLQQSFRPEEPDAGSKVFKTPLFYSLVRHPIQTGVVIAMLATPDLTAGRALLAVGMIAYVVIGLYFEERDLVAEFGDTYRDYRKRVPALFPSPRRR
ncbi:MAG: isoprenylcysteine carboxylmethyltransferase family protein [Pseudomonadales bacterium]|nr:isoprenylcysteine carboxylmethyltransferase family protein [Pseudomonadales bacterium]